MNSISAVALTAVGAFAITALLGFGIIPWLHKLKFGQTILDIGPKWHKNKQGTPTMGGIMFITGTTVSVVIVFFIDWLLKGNIVVGDYIVPSEIITKILLAL